jgi:predicted short-subunit dehydrogenase-like oxidoreductase (DUF2520 family)
MNIVIIGSGNVAAVLGRKFREAGHTITQVVSRNASAASALAYEWDTESTNYKSLIQPGADFYLIAVNDDAIAEVADSLQLPGRVVAHTAAAVPGEILKTVTPHYGVFYPLQSLRKEKTELPDVPVYFEGADEKSSKVLAELAESISPGKAREAGGTDRAHLHIAAVLVSNFTHHLYALAEEYCRREGLDFDQLIPLIRETAERAAELSPRTSQTGPAARGDEETIRRHLDQLASYPALQKIYRFLTESIQSGVNLS